MAQEKKPKVFEDALRKFPQVVAVVTVGRGGAENGLTVSWASPVSSDPLQIAIAVYERHYSNDFLRSTKSFVVNVLRADDKRLAAHFARQSFQGEDKLKGLRTREAPSGAAILEDALAWFDCEVTGMFPVGDHVLFVGKVLDAGVLGEGEPQVTNAAVYYSTR